MSGSNDETPAGAVPRLVAPDWGADALVVAGLAVPDAPDVRTAPVGSNPRAVAVSADGTRAYTANHDSGTLSVVDLGSTDLPVLRSVDAGNNPCAVVAGLTGDQVCVADWAGGQVTVFDKEGLSPAPRKVGAGPCALAAAPGGQAGRVCVVNGTDATVSVVDVSAPGSPSVAAAVPVPGATGAIAVAKSGRFAYVASRGDGTADGWVTVLDLDAGGRVVGAPVPVGAEPRALALGPGDDRLSVANYGSATVSVATVHPGTGRIGTPVAVPAGPHPVAVDFAPDGSSVLVVGQTSGTLTAVRVDTLAPTRLDGPVGAVPAGVVHGPEGAFAYVGDQATGDLVTVRTAPRKTAQITTGTGSKPVNTAVAPDGTWAYATDSVSDKVAVLDLGTLRPGTPVALGAPHQPWDVAIAADRTFACATGPGSSSLLVLTPAHGDTLTFDGAVTVTPIALAPGASPYGVAITPDGRYAVTADSGTATVSLVDPKGGRYTIDADTVDCRQPTGAALSRDGKTLYVADFASTQEGQPGGRIAVLSRTGPQRWQRLDPIDTATGHLSGPHELALSADQLRLCVANYQNGTVSVLQRATVNDAWTFHMAVAKSPTAMRNPYGLALTSDGRTLYVSNAAAQRTTVEVFDISAKPAVYRRTITVENDIRIPPGLALSPDEQYLYAAVSKAWMSDDTPLGTVYGTELAKNEPAMTVVATSPAAPIDRPNGLACRDDHTLYVVNQGRKDAPTRDACLAVLTLDTTRLAVQGQPKALPLDKNDVPYSIAAAGDGTAYIADFTSRTVTVLTSGVTPIQVGSPGTSRPWDVAVTDDGVHACASDRDAGTVHCVRLAGDHEVTSLAVGRDPMGVACAPGGARAFVAGHGDDTITVIALSGARGVPEVVATWRHPLIVKPESVSVSADGALLFVTGENNGAFLMLDTTTGTPLFSVPAGRALAGSAPDPRPATPRVYLADTEGSAVSVADTTVLGLVGPTPAAFDLRQARR
ncbi:beta-propeller fold lactonase family protein [Streptomyces sp. UNOB3_S3]|uniref:beta-propeller fold lactonase family protein n=1 Tax=Streptomyces sp. UNOB3_S3 TaxID=2871682 RepID=UPI001E601967|nr:beta-propeller fold lactonase family protein [Streptomyces sp. UNOB3_S3]MCC3773410.1 beta-propeller fold lactonase family protein [Streptomyces sp. UNOB3_S3]